MAQQEFYYKLIRPFQSNNVYLAHSLQSGAGKCFKEVIRTMPDSQQFSIMDINSNEIFDFNVNPPPISKDLISPNVSLSDIKELRDKIDNLEEIENIPDMIIYDNSVYLICDNIIKLYCMIETLDKYKDLCNDYENLVIVDNRFIQNMEQEKYRKSS